MAPAEVGADGAASGGAGEGAAASAFRLAFLADADAGRDLPAEHYAARFPDLAEHLPRLLAMFRDERPPPVAVPPPETVIARLLAPGESGYADASEIARGGMGVVLRVRDHTLGRDAAMKVLPGDDGIVRGGSTVAPDGATLVAGTPLRRFLREAHVTAQLTHPGVPPVYAMGVDTDGRVYFTMKFVRGRTLSDVFRLAWRGAEGWTVTRLLQAFLRVCETLAFAHSRGVIHRDLKPPNVMVGAFGEVYVMDWGLAKVLGGPSADEPAGTPPRAPSCPDPAGGDSLTVAGTVMGTPYYMPPEQAEGRHADVDARADVYAIGAMLYEMLARRPPYRETDDGTPHPMAVVASVAGGPPRPLREIAPETPPELAAVVARAMARDPADRYASAAEFAEDLHRYLDGRVVLAHRTGTLVEFRKWVGRHRAEAAGAAAVLALTILSVVVFAVRERGTRLIVEAERDGAVRARNDADRARRDAERAREAADAQRRRAEGLSLCARSIAVRPADPTLALLLAVEGASRAPGSDADEALHSALASQREVRRMTGHDGYVMGVSWSPDGTRLLSWEAGRLAILWDARTGALLHRLDAHDDVLGGAAFGPRGDRAITWSFDGTARVWDVATSGVAAVLAGHGGVVGAAALDATGARALTASDDGTARLWDATTGRELLVLRGHAGPAFSVAFHPDGRRAVTAGADLTARVWDLDTGAEMLRVATADGEPDPSAASVPPLATRTPPRADAAFFAAGGAVLVTWHCVPGAEVDAGVGRAFRVGDGALLRDLSPAPGTRVRMPVVSADGLSLHVATAGIRATTLRVLRLPDLSVERTVEGVPGGQTYEADGGGRWIGGATIRSADARILDARGGETVAVLSHNYAVTRVAFEPGGDRVATASCDGTVRLWRVLPEDLEPGAVPLRGVFGGDGTRAWVQERDAERRITAIRCVRLRDGVEEWRFPLDGAYRDAGLSEDGLVLTVATARSCSLLDPLSGTVRHRLAGPDWEADETQHVSTSPGGRLVARLGARAVDVFDPAAGRALHRGIVCRGLATHRAAWDAESRLLAVSNAGERIATLWDAASGAERARLVGHTGFVIGIAVSPDGSRVATSGADRSVRIWDAATGRPLAQNRTFLQGDLAITYSPDGRRLSVTGINVGVVLVDGATAEPLARIPQAFHYTGTAWFHPTKPLLFSREYDGAQRTWHLDPLPVARERLPCAMEPAVWRQVGFGTPAEFDAYDDAWTRANAGAEGLARRALREMDADRPDAAKPWIDAALAARPRHAMPQYALACWHARRGETAAALDALERALSADGSTPARPEEDLRLAPLRGEPRFTSLVERAGTAR